MFELKKFLFLCALEINKRKRASMEGDDPKPTAPFECPFVPPPQIDLAWRHLITFQRSYALLCELLCGGFIDRKDVRDYTPDQAFERYQHLQFALVPLKSFIKPFTNLWPPYKSAEELFEDYSHLTVVSESHQPKLKQFLRESTRSSAEEKLSIESCKMLSQMAQKTLC